MKNIIITGATGNLGKSVIAEFLKGDYHLHLAERKQTETTEKETSWYADLTNGQSVMEMIEHIEKDSSKIDAAIHLVGGYQPGDLENAELADIEKMVNLNFSTAFNLLKALLPHYQSNGGGKFIFIGAKAAMSPATAGYNVAYAFSKQLLVSLTEMINEAYRKDSISAHILLPSTLDTALNRMEMPDADFSKWTSTIVLAAKMVKIVDGDLMDIVISY